MVTITFKDGSTLVVDASMRQSHEQTNEVTDYPVESGAVITDNIRKKPRSFTLDGVISATPITAPGVAPPTNPHMAAYKRLEAAADAGATIGVATGLKVYKTLAIEGFSAPRDPETGIDLYFSLSLKEIVYASTATTTVPADAMGTATYRQASAQKHRGVAQASTATTAQVAATAKAKAGAAHKPQARFKAYTASL